MKRLYITIIICVLMGVMVPCTEQTAVSKTSDTYTHYIYMIGHAGWLHYAVNTWTLLALHNLYRWYRVLTAYIVAVVISYILFPPQPMVGASVITCFFIGFWTSYMWRKETLGVLMNIALLILTCLLPGFAGLPHLATYSTGLIFGLIEKSVWRIRNYLKY